MLDIYYLRETPEVWEIFGWASRDQRIRPRSWGEKKKSKRKGRKFYRVQEKMLLRAEFEGGAALNAGAILRG